MQMGCCCVQADVDLVSIMRRTGFLPSSSQQPGATSLVTQGGSQVGQIQGAGGRQASDGALQNMDTAKGGWQADALSPPQAVAAAATVSAYTSLYTQTCRIWGCSLVLLLHASALAVSCSFGILHVCTALQRGVSAYYAQQL